MRESDGFQDLRAMYIESFFDAKVLLLMHIATLRSKDSGHILIVLQSEIIKDLRVRLINRMEMLYRDNRLGRLHIEPAVLSNALVDEFSRRLNVMREQNQNE